MSSVFGAFFEKYNLLVRKLFFLGNNLIIFKFRSPFGSYRDSSNGNKTDHSQKRKGIDSHKKSSLLILEHFQQCVSSFKH